MARTSQLARKSSNKAQARSSKKDTVGKEIKEVEGRTTRKTIEIPEDYFYKVKLRAVQRRMLEKELWAEIVSEYFATHPV
jgi:hypothetical protein